MTGRYLIAQAVYASTRKHIPTVDLGKPEAWRYKREYLNHLHFADDILINAVIHHMNYNKCYKN